MELRGYQQRIVAAAVERNTIVMLPTGSGKTLIAAEVVKRLQLPGARARTVFFVPTCLLVKQQAAALRAWTHLSVAEYMGGMNLERDFDVLVTTPKAFEVAQARGDKAIQWPAVQLVVYDEVHHVLKDHPYRKLAASLRRSGETPRVLGLSASLTYAVGRAQVEAAVRRLCDDEIGNCIIEVASSEEMIADGYRGGVAAPAEVLPPTELPVDTETRGVVPVDARKPHLLLRTFLDRVDSGNATPFATALMHAVRAMEGEIEAFKSPIDGRKPLREWGEAAHKRAAASPRLAELEHYYEALRLLVVSWETADDAAATYLRMFSVDLSTVEWGGARVAIDAFWAQVPSSFPRFERLCDVLEYKLDDLPTFRGIVFVEQRVMTHVIEHVISSSPALQDRLKTASVYATKSPATASLRVSSAESAARLAAFKAGTVNLLVCTVVAEEGMDVPEANVVIRFDPMVHSVSYVQGRGRARAEGSSYVVLAERDDRPVALLAAVEEQQLELVREIARESAAGAGGPRDETALRIAQASRERAAASVLSQAVGPHAALGNLNLVCKKTKVDLGEKFTQVGTTEFTAQLTYESCLRTVTGEGRGVGKKAARQEAAVDLLTKLAVALNANANAGAAGSGSR